MALDTFKAQLKAKAKTLGVTNLSNKRIDAYAATLEKQNPNLATDDDHAEKVDAFLEIVDIKEIAAFDDYKATKAKKDGKPTEKKDPPTGDGDEGDDGQKPPADDPPAWFIAYKEEQDAKLNALLKEKQTATFQSKLKESLKDVPATFYDEWTLPEKEEDLEAFQEKVKTKWEAFSKENPVQTSSNHKPNRGSGGTDKKPDEKELDAIIDNIT